MARNPNGHENRGKALPRDPEVLLARIAQLENELEEERAGLCLERELTNASSIVMRWDASGLITYMNQYGRQLFGYLEVELLGRPLLGTVVPFAEENGRDLSLLIQNILRYPERYARHENENRSKEGKSLWVSWQNKAIYDIRGDFREMLSIGVDITERKKALDALSRSEKMFRALFQSTPVPLMERDDTALRAHLRRLQEEGITDIKAYADANPDMVSWCMSLVETRRVNDACLELFEAGSLEDLDTYLKTITIHRDLLSLMREALPDLAAGRITWAEREMSIWTIKGHRRDVVVRTTLVPGERDNETSVLVAIMDISQMKEAMSALAASERQFRFLSEHDNLTGLYNTRFLYQSLERLIREGEDSGRGFALIFMDLDHFKQVVDSRGHLAGSRAIQEVSATIQSVLQEPAFGVAYAGDEFVVVLPGAGLAEATAKAREIRVIMAESIYIGDDSDGVRLTASFGVAAYPEHASDLKGLLAQADKALFSVKGLGRNAVAEAIGKK